MIKINTFSLLKSWSKSGKLAPKITKDIAKGFWKYNKDIKNPNSVWPLNEEINNHLKHYIIFKY